MNEFTQDQKWTFWLVGAVERLIDLDLLSGDGPANLTPLGTSEWDQIDAGGIRPDNATIRSYAEWLMGEKCDAQALCTLLIRFRDDRSLLENFAAKAAGGK